MCRAYSFSNSFRWLVRRIGITDTHHGVGLQRGENFTGRVEDPGGTQSGVYMVMALGGVFFGGVYCDHLEGTLLQTPIRGPTDAGREPFVGFIIHYSFCC